MTFALKVAAPALFLSANNRLHHHARARLTRQWRDAGFIAAVQARLPKGLDHVHITAVVHPAKGGRLGEASNVFPSIKAAIDGVVGDYGLCPDDSDRHVTGPDIRRGENSVGSGFLLLLIEPLDREGLAA